jgi:hypothetical protein
MPTGTFALSETPEKDLRRARCLLFIIYVGMGGFFLYTLYQLFIVGRVEVSSTLYKVDSLDRRASLSAHSGRARELSPRANRRSSSGSTPCKAPCS